MTKEEVYKKYEELAKSLTESYNEAVTNNLSFDVVDEKMKVLRVVKENAFNEGFSIFHRINDIVVIVSMN